MPLNFPDQPDIRLENPPLAEVVCQVRFPPLLRIANEDPAEFQEHIRSEFPQIGVEHGFLLKIPGPGALGSPAAEPQSKIFRFLTPDSQTAISLAPDFYALSTKDYKDWDDFARYLALAHEAIQQVYSPAYATRIGLRYINRFSRSNTGCQTLLELLDILRPELTAQAHNDIWGHALEMNCRLVLSGEPGKLTLGTSYGHEGEEPVFVLDLDYFEEDRLEMQDLVSRVTSYNSILYRAFRWSIQDDKLSLFKPVTTESS